MCRATRAGPFGRVCRDAHLPSLRRGVPAPSVRRDDVRPLAAGRARPRWDARAAGPPPAATPATATAPASAAPAAFPAAGPPGTSRRSAAGGGRGCPLRAPVAARPGRVAPARVPAPPRTPPDAPDAPDAPDVPDVPAARRHRGLLIGVLATLAVVLITGTVWVGLDLRTTADSRFAGQAPASGPSAPGAPSSAAPPASPAGTGATTAATPPPIAPRPTTPAPAGPAGAQGVLAACRTILPAILTLETDVDTAGSPRPGGRPDHRPAGDAAHGRGAGAQPAFAGHVQKLADDFGRMAAAVRDGGDPSAALPVLQADGTTVGTDCGLARLAPLARTAGPERRRARLPVSGRPGPSASWAILGSNQ